jgi:hypothetical protein
MTEHSGKFWYVSNRLKSNRGFAIKNTFKYTFHKKIRL